MKEKITTPPDNNSKEKVADLKKQTTTDESVKKGYNEKNPTQPQGAFKPDSSEASS